MMKDQSRSDERVSRAITITMFENGDVDVAIDQGVTAFALYGAAGMLTLQGNMKMATAIAREAKGTGIHVPGRQ